MAPPVPYRYITGLPSQAQKEIERNFLFLQTQIVGASFPFTVVAADGSGSFTSIKAAIDSFPTNTNANDLSGVILVKQSASTYNDTGAGNVDLTNKQVIIIGQGPTSTTGLLRDTALSTNPAWNLDGLAGTGAARISIYGMDIVQANLVKSSSIRITVERCNLQSLSNVAPTSVKAIDCYFAQVVFNETSGVHTAWLKGCQLANGWAPAGATFTNGGIFRIEGCLITGQVTTTLNSDNATGGFQFEFVNNEINHTPTATWTFGLSGTEDRLIFSGNTRSTSTTGSLTLAFSGSGHGPQLDISGNNLPYTDLSITYSALDVAIHISGIYRSIAASSAGISCFATLDGRGSSTITLLTLSSGATGGVYTISAIPGTTTKAYAFAAGANKNIVSFANNSGCTTAGTDAGTGNLITQT